MLTLRSGVITDEFMFSYSIPIV